MPLREKTAMLRVMPWVVLIELGIRTMPVPRLARLLGVRVIDEPAVSPTVVPHNRNRLRDADIVALDRVYRRWPAGACLRRALIVGHKMRRADPVLRIGVARHECEVAAHAWIEVDGAPVAERVEAFTPLRSAQDTSDG